MEKRKSLNATLEPFKKREVKYLQPYYYQGGRWYKLGGNQHGSFRILSKLWKRIRRALA
jgi:hypothetical protein